MKKRPIQDIGKLDKTKSLLVIKRLFDFLLKILYNIYRKLRKGIDKNMEKIIVVKGNDLNEVNNYLANGWEVKNIIRIEGTQYGYGAYVVLELVNITSQL